MTKFSMHPEKPGSCPSTGHCLFWPTELPPPPPTHWNLLSFVNHSSLATIFSDAIDPEKKKDRCETDVKNRYSWTRRGILERSSSSVSTLECSPSGQVLSTSWNSSASENGLSCRRFIRFILYCLAWIRCHYSSPGLVSSDWRIYIR
mgnify:CR=1 FL=1